MAATAQPGSHPQSFLDVPMRENMEAVTGIAGVLGGFESYGKERHPLSAHVQDFRPGAIMLPVYGGQPVHYMHGIASYPFFLRNPLIDLAERFPSIREISGDVDPNDYDVWADTTDAVIPIGDEWDNMAFNGRVSLVDHGVVPNPNGLFSHRGQLLLVRTAPVTDPTVSKGLKELLEQPYDALTPEQQEERTVYFLGAQASSFLERKSDGQDKGLLPESMAKAA